MVDFNLLEDFVTETHEHLEEMEAALLRLDEQGLDKDLLNTVFRQLHTIKGSAEYLGLARIGELAHRLENLLDLIRHGKARMGRPMVDTLLASKDRIERLLRDLAGSGSEQTDTEDLLQAVDAFTRPATQDASFDPPAAGPAAATAAPPPEPSGGAAEGAPLLAADEETDQELYAIFLGQLAGQFDELKHSVSRLRLEGRALNLLDQCLRILAGLRSSANYMGYEPLVAIYDRLTEAFHQAREGARDPEKPFQGAAFLEVVVCPELAAICGILPSAGLTPELPELPASYAAGLGAENDRLDLSLFDELGDNLQSLEDDEEVLEKTERSRCGSRPHSSAAPAPEEADDDRPTGTVEVDAALIEEFLEEASEHLREMEDALLAMSGRRDHLEALNDVFRAVHTIKGSAEYIGFTGIADLCHSLEDMLELIRQGHLAVDNPALDLLLSARDRLSLMMPRPHGGAPETIDAQDLIQRIRAAYLAGADSQAPAPTTEAAAAAQTPLDSAFQEVLGEDYDEELFGIFLDQLADQLRIVRTHTHAMALPAAPAPADDLRACREALGRLKYSANYMGYDGLRSFYEGWLVAIEAALAAVEREPGVDLTACLQEVMTPNLTHLEGLAATLRGADGGEACGLSGGSEAPAEAADSALETVPNLDTTALSDGAIAASAAIDLPLAPEGVEDALIRRLESAFAQNVLQFDLGEAAPQMELVEAELFAGDDEDPAVSGPEDDVPTTGDDGMDHEILVSFVDAAAGPPPETRAAAQAPEEPTALSVAAGSCPPEDAAELGAGIGFDPQPAPEDLFAADDGLLDSGPTEPFWPGIAALEEMEEEDDIEASPGGGMALQDLLTPLPGLLEAPPVPTADAGPPSPAEASEAAPTPSAARAERLLKHSIRVDAAKIDSLMNQVGELVVNRATFSQLNAEMRGLVQYLKQMAAISKKDLKAVRNLSFRLSEATVALGRVANDLQEGIMKVRMLPVSQLFNRYPRLAHDLTRNSGKKVQLVIRGEETELDKMVIEEIADPLVHIIRNAVDHGIETLEQRRAAGKPETGRIQLEAFHESNYVVIDITDDGRGIDLEHIRAKALAQGLASAEFLKSMTAKDMIDLIATPGFSTAEQVTHTSGRGVGMDVVKRNIEKINGTLEMDSAPGQGTRFRIKIPLTLAIFPALLVRVAEELFTIPLSAVNETIRVYTDELTVIEGIEVLHLRDTPLPLLRLAHVFNMPAADEQRRKLFVVVVSAGARRVGLVVDELIGQEEVVIKPLEDYLQENSGFSGATILGDGRISLILDVYELIRISIDQQICLKARTEVV